MAWWSDGPAVAPLLHRSLHNICFTSDAHRTEGGSMDTERRINLLEGALSRQQKNSAAADLKVSTLIGINTTMLAVLA